jgi:hypothetical protein
VYDRAQELASLEFARHAEQQLLTSPHTFAFVEGDLLALNPRIKHMNLVDLASGVYSTFKAHFTAAWYA